ncbi:hypothetical protein Ciccas_009988 [Cichlidogyrus casuarinus]|uniref:Uncharacterized protein n=1 Tax=Cichlidogyrus casuarinus TaxID=1844966 RepID=A0ABD2PVD7_9PLAT
MTLFFFLLMGFRMPLETEKKSQSEASKPTHLDVNQDKKKNEFVSNETDSVSELGWNLIIKNAKFSHVKNLVSFANGEKYQLTKNFSFSKLWKMNSAVNSVADYKIHASYLGNLSEFDFNQCISKDTINRLRKDLMLIFKKWMQLIAKDVTNPLVFVAPSVGCICSEPDLVSSTFSFVDFT